MVRTSVKHGTLANGYAHGWLALCKAFEVAEEDGFCICTKADCVCTSGQPKAELPMETEDFWGWDKNFVSAVQGSAKLDALTQNVAEDLHAAISERLQAVSCGAVSLCCIIAADEFSLELINCAACASEVIALKAPEGADTDSLD